MRKTIFKRVLGAVCALTLIAGMSTAVLAADSTDIVLNDAGSPFIKTFDSGSGDAYTYLGYVYCSDQVTSDYKYLQITYTGDATAFDQLRLEFVTNDGNDTMLAPCWFTQNDQGTFKTVDDTLVPAPSATEQTVVIDLEKSGLDISNGVKAFHVHDTQGTGSFTITDARLMTSYDTGTVDDGEDTGAGDSSMVMIFAVAVAAAAVFVTVSRKNRLADHK